MIMIIMMIVIVLTTQALTYEQHNIYIEAHRPVLLGQEAGWIPPVVGSDRISYYLLHQTIPYLCYAIIHHMRGPAVGFSSGIIR